MAKKKAAKQKWQKSPAGLVEAFDKALDKLPEGAVERRKMFGYPCAFVNGNMCCGLHEVNCIVRLDEAGRENAISNHGAAHFEPMGRRMREYIALPPTITSNGRKFNNWIAKAFAHTASLPQKPPKKKTTRKH